MPAAAHWVCFGGLIFVARAWFLAITTVVLLVVPVCETIHRQGGEVERCFCAAVAATASACLQVAEHFEAFLESLELRFRGEQFGFQFDDAVG